MEGSPMINISTIICSDAIKVSGMLNEIHHYDLSRQLFKSCSSIGANIREAQFAEGKKDFVHKLSISLKECNESLYWIYSIKDSELITDPIIDNLQKNCFSILRILKSAIKTTKQKYNI